MILRVFVLFVFMSVPAFALELPSQARRTADELSQGTRYGAPVSVFDGTHVPQVAITGRVHKQAWRVPGAGLTPEQLSAPLHEQLTELGYRKALDCAARACGGFDFRFATEVLPAPAIYVNLRNFQFTTYIKGPLEAPEAVATILTSSQENESYVQIIQARQADAPPLPEAAPLKTPDIPELSPVPKPQADLLSAGFLVLEGVEFESGATALRAGDIAILAELARYLAANPKLKIALVGHTDSVGALEKNIRISKARAQAVRNRLIKTHGVDPAQLVAEGMGYLAPRASNLTIEGREANRRVEAIILSTE